MSSSNDATAKLVEAARKSVDSYHYRPCTTRTELRNALSAFPTPSPAVAEGTRWASGGGSFYEFHNGEIRFWSETRGEWMGGGVTLEHLDRIAGPRIHPTTPPAPESVPTAEEVADKICALPGIYLSDLERSNVIAIITADRDRLARRVAELEEHGHRLIITQNAYVAELKATIADLRAKLAAAGGGVEEPIEVQAMRILRKTTIWDVLVKLVDCKLSAQRAAIADGQAEAEPSGNPG